MTPHRAVLTYHDYAALPDDGRRYEIHDGELSLTPAPSPQHQRCAANLFRTLNAHVRAHGLGEVLFAPLDVILSDTSIVQPDLVYLAPDRLGVVSRRGIEGPPTLAVEILSPSTTAIDRATKHDLYARHGIALRASGAAPVDPPPFPGLALVPMSLWP